MQFIYNKTCQPDLVIDVTSTCLTLHSIRPDQVSFAHSTLQQSVFLVTASPPLQGRFTVTGQRFYRHLVNIESTNIFDTLNGYHTIHSTTYKNANNYLKRRLFQCARENLFKSFKHNLIFPPKNIILYFSSLKVFLYSFVPRLSVRSPSVRLSVCMFVCLSVIKLFTFLTYT